MRIALGLALAACTSSVPPYTVGDYEDELGLMHCRRMTDCCTPDEYQDWWTDGSGHTYDCVQAHQNPPDRSDLVRGVAAGTIHFDAAAAHACVAALEALACTDFEPGIRFRETYCESPFHGAIADGDRCLSDDECASTFCAVTDHSIPGGTCQPRLADGAACELGDPCPRAEACQLATNTCGAGFAAGATCPGDSQCADDWCKGAGFFIDGQCVRACDGQ